MTGESELAVIGDFINVLELLDIRYAIGGSIASSVYGYVRFTQDADIAAAPFENKIGDFCNKLADTFYLSEEAIRQAHGQGGSFNVIHLTTAFKIDVFICRQMFHKQMLSRRKKLPLDESLKKEMQFVSPEDIVLLKLQWYQEGGAVSERQWTDILGVMKTQAGNLDVAYLRQWAEQLNIRPLLEKAIEKTQ